MYVLDITIGYNRYTRSIFINIILDINLVGGIPTPLKNMKVNCVNWDDDIPNIYIYIIYIWKNKHVPNHQPEMGIIHDMETYAHQV